MLYPLPTTLKDGVPVVFHEPHVIKGFRPVHQPWSSYLLSMFQWHNELMNVWTHLLALVIVLKRAWSWSGQFDLLFDPYMWPLSVVLVTLVILYICSSGAHLFQNRSELVHYTCFMFDYAGIGLYGFGSTMVHYWYCLHEELLGSLSHQLAIPVGAFLAILACVCCAISKTMYKRPYPFTRRIWQMSSVLAMYVWLNFPIWYRIYLYIHDGQWESSFSHHLQQMAWFTSGGFFFGSDIPQRFLPGVFDMVGHSHQLFHVCILMTTYEQMNALYLEITDDISLIHKMQPPTFAETWGVLAFVIMANLCVVYIFHQLVKARLEREMEKKQDGDTDNHKLMGGKPQVLEGEKEVKQEDGNDFANLVRKTPEKCGLYSYNSVLPEKNGSDNQILTRPESPLTNGRGDLQNGGLSIHDGVQKSWDQDTMIIRNRENEVKDSS